MSTGEMRYAVGIDFGGTFVKIALVDDLGQIVARRKVATSEWKTTDDGIQAMATSIHELADEGVDGSSVLLQGVGIGVPGFVDCERGLIHQLPNVPGWNGVPLATLMRDRVGLNVRVDNDVNVMAVGECTYGTGRSYQHAVLVTLGTGVGGALLINNRLYRGARSMAGEIGHMTIDMNGIPSPMGRGGLEEYVGNRQIIERTHRLLDEGRPSLLNTLSKGDRDAITPEMIQAAAEKGDILSIEIYDFVAECIAAAFASITYLLQPQVFIVGGGIGQSGRVLFDPLRKHLRERLSPHFGDHVEVKAAALGNDGGVIGGATMLFMGGL